MFQNLRKRFIYIAMFSVTIVLIGIISFIDIFYYLQVNKSADDVLEYLANNGGRFPEDSMSYKNPRNPFSEETPYRTRFFTVTVNERDDVTSINMGHVAAVLPSEAYIYAQNVIERGKKTGYFQDYKYLITDTDDGYQIIFLDRTQELESVSFLVFCSIAIGSCSLVIIFILINILSKPIIEPVIKNAIKQRQFITDASHEIKTPLAIISADTDVIEIEHGKDEWTESIKEQVKRLTELVQSMLTLSKMDADIPEDIITNFDASKVISEKSQEFKPIAVNDNIRFLINIEPDMEFKGNKDGIDQLTSVLLNNAFKYTNDQGTIRLNAVKKGKSLTLDVINTTDSMPQGDLRRLFDRFYRDDKARSRETGSYGIGLSIAQAVVQQHKGSIAAKKINDNTILFRAILNSF